MTDIAPELRLRLYETMLRIRRFEEETGSLFAAGELPGFVHLSIGQEAVATGVCSALGPRDTITATHRGHGHILAKGADMGRMMAELMGKRTGYCAGKGGSMHIFSLELGVLGANGILGAGQPIAVGAGLSAKLQGSDRVSVTFFGEGASAQGGVHEAMNLAAIWKLPVVFVAEINGYAELTPFRYHVSVPSMTDRAAGYGIPAVAVDGTDVEAVHEATREAVAQARSGAGPVLIEARTNRWRGHFEGDRQLYRPEGEVDSLAERDPLTVQAGRLVAAGLIGEEGLDAIERRVADEVAEAVAFGKGSPEAAPEDALLHVYVHGGLRDESGQGAAGAEVNR
jgi:pyruvate dehydrogenase E1 component alpha subunit